jgi:hypothetical protein
MSRSVTAERQLALSVLPGVVVTFLLPALATSDTTMPAVAGVVLALAALVALATRSLAQAACLHPMTSPVADAPRLVLPGRVTDRVHHPLRPRAPGQV